MNFSRFFLGPERGLLSKVKSSYFNGIRVITIGGIAAFSGAAMVALGAEDIGVAIVIVGITVGVVGLCLHIFLIVNALFKRKKKLDREKNL